MSSFFSYIIVCLVTQSCPTFCNPMDCSPPGSSVHGDSPGKHTGVDCHVLLQGIFATQGSNPGLPHCRRILCHLSHQESPRILKWVAYPFSRGSSWPRNWTGVSCIAGRFFTSWADRESRMLFSLSPHIQMSMQPCWMEVSVMMEMSFNFNAYSMTASHA